MTKNWLPAESGAMVRAMERTPVACASSGLGRELARQIEDVFPDIACYWLIARREDRLEGAMVRAMERTPVACFKSFWAKPLEANSPLIS